MHPILCKPCYNDGALRRGVNVSLPWGHNLFTFLVLWSFFFSICLIQWFRKKFFKGTQLEFELNYSLNQRAGSSLDKSASGNEIFLEVYALTTIFFENKYSVERKHSPLLSIEHMCRHTQKIFFQYIYFPARKQSYWELVIASHYRTICVTHTGGKRGWLQNVFWIWHLTSLLFFIGKAYITMLKIPLYNRYLGQYKPKGHL